MKFYIRYFLFSFFFSTIFIHAQEIYIPYREGKLWGIVNENNQIIIPPKFDSIQFNDQDEYDFRMMHSFKNNKRGLLISGKEILEPKFDEIFATYKKYFVAKTQENGKQLVYILDVYGNPMTEKPVLGIIFAENLDKNRNEILLHVINQNEREDVLIWDTSNKKISQYVFKDYYSVSLPKVERWNGIIRYKKNENDPLSEKFYRIENNLLVENSLKTRETVVKNISYNNRESTRYEIEGIKDTYYTPPPPPPMGNSDNASSTQNSSQKELPKKELKSWNVLYMLENNVLKAKLTNIRNYQKAETVEKIIPLPKNTSQIQIKNAGNTRFSKQDTALDLYNFSNYVTYKNNKRYGLVFGKMEPMEFDTIKILSYTNHREYAGKLSFLVGNRDQKSKIMKYNILDFEQNKKFSVDYDQIIEANAFGGSDYNNWIFVKNNLFGIARPDGKIMLETKYDEIINKEHDFGDHNFLQLKKNNKYGYFKELKTGKIDIFEPVFDFPIQDIFYQYPLRERMFSGEAYPQNYPKTITLIALQDSKGKLLGYANANGTLYFKN